MPMTGPCTGSLLSKLTASGDGLCRVDKTVFAKEARSRLPKLNVRRLRELWCRRYKTAASATAQP
jgi:hypothetical protein